MALELSFVHSENDKSISLFFLVKKPKIHPLLETLSLLPHNTLCLVAVTHSLLTLFPCLSLLLSGCHTYFTPGEGLTSVSASCLRVATFSKHVSHS